MSSEPVRSYLLGMIDESSAASIEERYFTDREFFLFVQAVEVALIKDYLARQLTPALRSRFEARYLSVPTLRQRLEEVREAHLHAPMGHGHTTRLLMVAAIILVCVAGAALWIYLGRTPVDSSSASPRMRPLVATLSISPGLLKGNSIGGTRLAQPSKEGDVLLLLELPGQRTQLLCSPRVSISQPDGAWKRVWSTSQPLWSTPSQGGQQIALRIDALILTRGDYLVEIVGPDGNVLESYSFRISPM
jgi:hypothetical protein